MQSSIPHLQYSHTQQKTGTLHGMNPTISLIAALGAHTRAIGKNNGLLWHIHGDLPRFRHITEGHPVIMGSNTFKSIGKPLPNRTNIVLTTQDTDYGEGIFTAHTTEEALEYAKETGAQETFIIGGGSVYTQTIHKADKLYLTLVHDEAEGDVFFPPYNHLPFKEVWREDHLENNPPFSWVTLERNT
jgi:dihydrofolate reductase